MIIILSAINGLEALVNTLSSRFDADIRITPATGKSFDSATFPHEEITAIPGVALYSEIVEEICIVRHRDRFVHAMMKGVEPDFFGIAGMESLMDEGSLTLYEGDEPAVLIETEIAHLLGFRPTGVESVTLFAPLRSKKIKIGADPFRSASFPVNGTFSALQDESLKYVLLPLDEAISLLDYGGDISAVEIGLEKGSDEKKIKRQIAALAGENFEVKTRFEQNELLYKISQSEKWFTFVMLSFVLLLTSFNIVASLTMLVIDKKQDIGILRSMGADNTLIRRIFFLEGLFINLSGACIGLVLGTGIVLLQQFFHLVPLQGAIIEYYPVALRLSDFIYIVGVVGAIGVLCSWVPVRFLVKKHLSR